MIQIDLYGCYTAVCVPYGVEIKRKKHGVVDECCRAIIEAGGDPEDEVVVVRNGTVCFDVVPLSVWAGKRLTEHDHLGFKRRKYQPNERFKDD